MIGIDTNVLLRYILRDDAAQAKKADQLIEGSISRGIDIFINRMVLCETAWALHQSYRLPKSEIVLIMKNLLEAEGFIIDAEEEALEALENYRLHNLDFPDAFIAADNRRAGAAHTATFDKKAAKLAQFKLVG